MQFRRFIFLISKLLRPSEISFHSHGATCVKVQRGALAYSWLLCSISPHAAELPLLQADGPTSNISFPCHLLFINWNIVTLHYNFLGHCLHVSIFLFSVTLNTHAYKCILPGSRSFLTVISAEKIFFFSSENPLREQLSLSLLCRNKPNSRSSAKSQRPLL